MFAISDDDDSESNLEEDMEESGEDEIQNDALTTEKHSSAISKKEDKEMKNEEIEE